MQGQARDKLLLSSGQGDLCWAPQGNGGHITAGDVWVAGWGSGVLGTTPIFFADLR